MVQFKTMRKIVAGLVVAGSMIVAGTQQASAGGYYNPPSYAPPACHWVTVVTWQEIQKPCVHWITKYDCYGNPYQAKVVTFKTVRIPVEKQVKVCH